MEENVADIFPQWRNKVAIDRNGLVMKHALDLAIMLDTMAIDPRLNLEHHFSSVDGLLIFSNLFSLGTTFFFPCF
jgi:hypothetical protein